MIYLYVYQLTTEHFLLKFLTSIINQINDYKVQVVIYDSASTDDTKEVVYYFKKQFKDIKYIHSEKKKVLI